MPIARTSIRKKASISSSLLLALALPFSASQAAIPTDALVSHWKMEGNTGNTMIDEKGVNHGNYYNGAAQVQGYDGSAMQFDGTDDLAVVLDNSTLDFGANNFTVSFWFKKLSPTSKWDNCEGISKWNNGSIKGSNEWALSICSGINSNGTIFSFETSTKVYSITSAALPADTWNHVAGVREGNFIKLYVNGTIASSTFVGIEAVNNIGKNLYIAQSEQIGWPRNSHVAIDDIAIHNRALTPEELIGIPIPSTEPPVDTPTLPPIDCSELQNQLDIANLMIEQIRSEVVDLNAQLQSQIIITSNLTLQRDALQQQLDDLTTENSILRQQIAGITAERDLLQQQVEALNAKNEILREQFTELTLERDNLQQQVNNLVTENVSLSQQVVTLNLKIDNMQLQVTILTAENALLRQGNADLQNKLNQYGDIITAAISIIENRLGRTIPGDTPLEQLDNLLNAITGLNHGRLRGILRGL